MPPGLNSNGRTLPGRHGVAATPPGSQMFAHMRSLNNTTLAVWVLSAGPMASLGRDQMAPSPVCQVGFVAATREMPHGRRMGVGGRGAWTERVANYEENKQTHIAVTFAVTHTHFLSLRLDRSFPSTHTVDTEKQTHFMDVNTLLMQNYQHYINQERSLTPTQHHLHVCACATEFPSKH